MVYQGRRAWQCVRPIQVGSPLLGRPSRLAEGYEQSLFLDGAGPRRWPGKQQRSSQSPRQWNDSLPGCRHRTTSRDLVPAARVPPQAKPRPLVLQRILMCRAEILAWGQPPSAVHRAKLEAFLSKAARSPQPAARSPKPEARSPKPLHSPSVRIEPEVLRAHPPHHSRPASP